MTRRLREDYPGAWHHVTNRAIARRTMFEGARDVEVFCAGMARERESGQLEVHAYSLLSTHFHLLVRSPKGALSDALRRLQNGYSRYFNRARRRDGPLLRGRFSSRLVESDSYWLAVLWYIDRNPIAAGLAARSTDYPHGSAAWYARKEGPAWLTREVVEATVSQLHAEAIYDPASYPGKVGGPDLAWVDDVVERRMRHRGPLEDPYRDLVGAAPEAVLDWMERKARLADGTPPGMPIASPEAVMRGIHRGEAVPIRVRPRPGRRPLDVRHALTCGLLRDLAGLTDDDLATMLSRSAHWVRQRRRDHRHAMGASSRYRDRAAGVLRRALEMEAGRNSGPGIDGIERGAD